LSAITKSEAQTMLWNEGILSWKLRPEQKAFKKEIEKEHVQLVVGNISRRLGKTYSLVLYAIEQALISPQKIRYGAAFLTDLEEFLIPTFEIILADCPESIRPEYLKSRKIYRFPNGSEVKLVGLDKNPNGLRGNALNIIIIDEAGFVSNLKYLYQSVIIPATAKQDNIKIIIISTPPESPEHYFVELIQKAQTEENGYYLHLTIDDISDLDPKERQRLLNEVGGEHSSTARREFFCEIIIDAERAIAPAFDAKIHVAEFDEPNIKWMLFGDAGGVRDITAWLQVGWSHTLQKNLIRDELWFKPHTATSEIVEEVKAKWDTDKLPMTLDCAGQLQIDYSSLGLQVMLPKKDGFSETLLLINNSFYNNQTLIHPDCKLLVQTLAGCLTNRNRTDFERSPILGHADAAMSYAYSLRGIDRATDFRPKPKRSEVFTIEYRDPIESELEKLKGF